MQMIYMYVPIFTVSITFCLKVLNCLKCVLFTKQLQDLKDDDDHEKLFLLV